MRPSILIFIIILVLLGGMIVSTIAFLTEHMRIGLDFFGGYEILYEVEPTSSTISQVSHDQLLQVAMILEDRAKTLGISEPQIDILGDSYISISIGGITQRSDLNTNMLSAPMDVPVHLVEQRADTVGGFLTEDELRSTVFAGITALACVFVILVGIYWIDGLIAFVSVTVFIWLLLIAFNILQTPLSLSAMVAFILALGLAVDANILVIERIREERRRGLSRIDAVSVGP